MEQNGMKFCQSCGMPMGEQALYGTNADGSKNEDYCRYCFEKGEFTFHGGMEEMIGICVPHMTEANPGMSADQARQAMREWFPTLKRWKKKSEAKRS